MLQDDSCANICSSEEQEDKWDTEYKIEEEELGADDGYSSSSSSSEEEEIKYSNSSKKRKRWPSTPSIIFKWTEEDEMLVLKQLCDFAGDESGYSKQVFYEYVKKRLSNRHVSVDEIKKKVDGLKKEYLKNERIRKLEKNGWEWAAHRRRVFVLSKQVWGAEYHKNDNRMKLTDSEGFLKFLQAVDVDVNCLTLSCLEGLKKDWAIQLRMYMELLSHKSNFDVKLLQLIIHNTQKQQQP